MKRIATTFLNQYSNDLILLYTFPIPYRVYAITHANKTTGIPVAIENTTGK